MKKKSPMLIWASKEGKGIGNGLEKETENSKNTFEVIKDLVTRRMVVEIEGNYKRGMTCTGSNEWQNTNKFYVRNGWSIMVLTLG